MRIGKLTNQELEEIVLSRLPRLSSRTITGSQVGADCAWLNFGSNLLVASTDPVTAGGMQSGRLAIHVSCNDIAACGVNPVGILMVIIAPPSVTREELLQIVDQASETAESLGVDIVGGHTEISDSVTRFVVTTTAFGIVSKSDFVPLGCARPGDTLLMTKTAAIEGSWIAAMEHEDRLTSVLTPDQLSGVRGFLSDLSVVKEGVLAASCPAGDGTINAQGFLHSAVHLMHDVTEGGVFGAAYEMADLSGTGLILEPDAIPVHPATKEITTALHLDVMRLISSGSLLIATPEPEVIMAKLRENRIQCTAIGSFIEKGFFTKDRNGDRSLLLPPDVDELYKL